MGGWMAKSLTLGSIEDESHKERASARSRQNRQTQNQSKQAQDDRFSCFFSGDRERDSGDKSSSDAIVYMTMSGLQWSCTCLCVWFGVGVGEDSDPDAF